jgi:hypothetical protein
VPRLAIVFETRVTDLKTGQSCLGSACGILESGISVVQSLELAPDDPVRLEMADCVAVGRIVYSNAEGKQFRLGIEVQRFQLGNSSLSNLLRRTLVKMAPSLLDSAESEVLHLI